MSAATSPGTGLAYGLRRVCAAWGMARSSFYAMTSGQHAIAAAGKASGTEARDLGPGAAGGELSTTLRHRRFLFTDSFLLLVEVAGGLIQTASGSGAGFGVPWTKRSG